MGNWILPWSSANVQSILRVLIIDDNGWDECTQHLQMRVSQITSHRSMKSDWAWENNSWPNLLSNLRYSVEYVYEHVWKDKSVMWRYWNLNDESCWSWYLISVFISDLENIPKDRSSSNNLSSSYWTQCKFLGISHWHKRWHDSANPRSLGNFWMNF